MTTLEEARRRAQVLAEKDVRLASALITSAVMATPTSSIREALTVASMIIETVSDAQVSGDDTKVTALLNKLQGVENERHVVSERRRLGYILDKYGLTVFGQQIINEFFEPAS